MATSIPSTLELVIKCWNRAEHAVSSQWQFRSANAGEEFVTELLYQFLQKECKIETDSGRLKAAIQDDLCTLDPALQSEHLKLEALTHDMFVECALHNHTLEGKTGGDFGLLFANPEFERQRYSQNVIKISMRDQGMLCQAKIRQKNGRWGELRKRQKKALEGHNKYFALVLYDYEHKAGSLLEPFKWISCAGRSATEVETNLREDVLNGALDSTNTIRSLANGVLGTDDKDTIDTLIRTKRRPEFEIRIGWRGGEPPPSMAYNVSKAQDVVRVFA